MQDLPITATAVASMKRAAKRRVKSGSVTYSVALEQEAVEAGYPNWHAVTQLQKAEQDPSALPLDPILPDGFYQTPNDERSAEELELWWERPYVCTQEDGSLDVRCLEGGCWDRPTFYGRVANMPEAHELAKRKLARWRRQEQQPVLIIQENALAMAQISHHPHREPLILAEFPVGAFEAANAWRDDWLRRNPEPDLK